MFKKMHEFRRLDPSLVPYFESWSCLSQEDGATWGVALLLALFVLLGTRAQYNAVQYNGPWEDFEDYDEREYDFDEDEEMEGEEEDYQEEDADSCTDPEGGEPPRADPQNQEFTPMCNNENCWIRVDWEPPLRDTWMSCLLGYKVGFRNTKDQVTKYCESWIFF